MAPSASRPALDDAICDLAEQAAEESAGRTLERVLPIVEAHARAEEASMASYRELMNESGDPAVALVMMLVMEDEYRHHSLLQRLSRRMHDALEWTQSADALPSATHTTSTPPVSGRMAALAEALAQEEHEGAAKLRGLAHQEAGINGGLDALLLEVMALDSEKHARLLTYVASRLEARSTYEDGPLD